MRCIRGFSNFLGAAIVFQVFLPLF